MEWFKSCCSAGTASGQAFHRAALTCRGCLLPSAWEVPSRAWLRTTVNVPRMLLEYRQCYVICSLLRLIQSRQLRRVPKGLSNKMGSLRGWKVVRGFSPVVKLNGSRLSHVPAHLSLHIAVLNNCAYGRMLKLEALCMTNI